MNDSYGRHIHSAEQEHKDAIPWIGNMGKNVQISIGITQAGNVEHYATNICSNVKSTLKNRQMKVVASDSVVDVAANHNVIVYPEGACSLDIFCYGLSVAKKVKGCCREQSEGMLSRTLGFYTTQFIEGYFPVF